VACNLACIGFFDIWREFVSSLKSVLSYIWLEGRLLPS